MWLSSILHFHWVMWLSSAWCDLSPALVSIIYLPMNIVYILVVKTMKSMQRLCLREKRHVQHPMHKMWDTFCRQVTTRLRCSSQLPWLQQSEMVECWSDHSNYGMVARCCTHVRCFISTIFMFPFDCPQFPKVKFFPLSPGWNSHCVTKLTFPPKVDGEKFNRKSLDVGSGRILKLSHWNKGWNCKLFVLLYVLDVRVNHRYLYLHHVHIYMRVEQKVHERGFLCVSLWVCN